MAKYFSLKLLLVPQNCHPDRSVAQWRDLLCFSSSSHTDSSGLGIDLVSNRPKHWPQGHPHDRLQEQEQPRMKLYRTASGYIVEQDDRFYAGADTSWDQLVMREE